MNPPAHRPVPPATTEVADVLIIGGGPAGSTAATWLARRGHRVVLCEKASFPRFHVGESLIPESNRILREIGAWEAIASAGFIRKYGAEFTVRDGSTVVHNVFSEGLRADYAYTFQVERARFDQILLNHAAQSGAEVRQQTEAYQPEFDGSHWTLQTRRIDRGTGSAIRARWVIDASGRHSLMAGKLGLARESLPYPGRFAIFNHFEGIPRNRGKEAGNIIIVRLKQAWFWIIPTSGELTSVGLVAEKGAGSPEKGDLARFFQAKVAESAYMERMMAQATTSRPFRIDSDYCFSYQTFGASQALLAGDAASFIDPVFSSGVYLALESGLLAARRIDQALAAPASAKVPDRLYADYTRQLKQPIAQIRRMIDAFYDRRSFEVFMQPRPFLKLPAAVNTILAGKLRPSLSVRWRLWLFRLICRAHQRRRIVPGIEWEPDSKVIAPSDSPPTPTARLSADP